MKPFQFAAVVGGKIRRGTVLALDPRDGQHIVRETYADAANVHVFASGSA